MAETIISINLESVKEKARQKKEEVDNVRIAVNEITGMVLTSMPNKYLSDCANEDGSFFFTLFDIPLINDNSVPTGELQFISEC